MILHVLLLSAQLLACLFTGMDPITGMDYQNGLKSVALSTCTSNVFHMNRIAYSRLVYFYVFLRIFYAFVLQNVLYSPICVGLGQKPRRQVFS